MKEFSFDEEMSIGVDVTVHVSGHMTKNILDWEYEDEREIRSVSINGKDLPFLLINQLRPYLQDAVDSKRLVIP